MAHSLVWADLSEEQIELLRNAPYIKNELSARDIVAKLSGLHEEVPREAITLDLYMHTLQYGQERQFKHDKLSGLFSIMKEVHRRSTEGRMPVDRSFAVFKQLMLQHSVQRPPYSISLFSMPEYKAVLEWGLDTYYRYYKLYMYTYTDRVVMNVSQQHPADAVELAPQGWMQSLDSALTQEQHSATLREQEQQRLAALDAEAAAAAAAAEEERIARVREEYEGAVPDEVRDQVTAVVEKELALLRHSMEAQFEAQQQELLAKIAALELKTAAQ
ncbi:central apparatus associated protein C1a-34 [Haematococcus lacustris]